MDLPPIPLLKNLESISPSFYNAALLCKARAAWQQFGARNTLPASTGAILGSCFHAVMEVGNQGVLQSGEQGIHQAKAIFDREAHRRFAESHPLIRAKFSSPEKFPFFFGRRAKAVTLAVQAPANSPACSTNRQEREIFEPTERTRLVEQTLSSADGLIKGRIDLWEKASATVTDYKSGQEPKNEPFGMTENEVRQLRLYVHLVLENHCAATKAAIVRGDGRRSQIDVSEANANQEGQAARQTLIRFNQAVSNGQSFSTLASPSPTNCAGCPCLALCDPFWHEAKPEWEKSCGTNVEGEIAESRDITFAGTPLRTLQLKSCHGSAPPGDLVAEQIPLPWLSIGSTIPSVGNIVRVVSAVRTSTNIESRVLQVDRIKSTAIWNAPQR
jgi:hypothetical protein